MKSLVFQISSASALLVLLSQLWRYASLERAFVVTLGVGLAVYGVLFAGQAVLRHVSAQEREVPEPESEPPPVSVSPTS